MQFEDLLVAGQNLAESFDVGDDLLNRNVLADALPKIVNPMFVLGMHLVVGLTAGITLRMLCLHFKQIRILQYFKKISY